MIRNRSANRIRPTVPLVERRTPRPVARKPLNVVQHNLQAYADRGVFRGLSRRNASRGLPAFEFVWLAQRPLTLSVDAANHVLRFGRILPGVPASSTMYAELKMFIRGRHDHLLPAHRRVDIRRAEASCSNRGGVVSIALQVKRNHYAYGVNRIVNLVHELFVHLRDAYPDYLVEYFDARQE